MNDFFKALMEEEKLLKKLKQLKKKSSSSSFINIPHFQDSKTLDSDFKINWNDNNYSKKKKNQSESKTASNSEVKVSSVKTNNESFNKNHSSKTSSSSSSNSHGGGSHISFYAGTSSKSFSKGGVVINNQSIIVKTNFEMSGRLNKSGKRPTSKEVGSHTSASLNYMDNHGSRDLENDNSLSNTYHENGERMTKEEFKELDKDLKENTQAFRRIIIDTGQKEFNREDLNKLVRESMQNFKEQNGKNFEFKFAIHTDTEQIHAHVTAFGSNADINFTKEHLQSFKEIVGGKSQEILLNKQLEQDRELTLNQLIDKQIDGVLDNKFENTATQEEDFNKGLTL
ncbi:hypothetical protein O8C83_05785 [Aliarcobacter butzleri]|uniref:relaxase/mobilization nuclease domain-containing protein n=1 Tax=Aliarcobacter butzleri TaxID=28197 RepID=UPI00263C421D|nr:hypothetical protein [Aliarcobacter butzleri]MDN5100327.1 hypothetical protein [Aliarcobacter butzleri]